MATTPLRGYPLIDTSPDAAHDPLPQIRDFQMAVDSDVDAITGGVAVALGDPGANGLIARTAPATTSARAITGTSNQIFVVNGDGVSGDPTLSIPSNAQLSIAKIANLTGNGFVKTSGGDGSLSIDTTTYLNAANNLSDLVSTSTARSNLGVAIGSNVQAWDADLDAIAALAGTSGLLKKTGADTWALDTSTYATQAYADALVVGLLDDRGNFDASGNLFPSSGGSGSAGAILKGDLWTISVAGTLGGHPVTPGDVVRALTDTPGQTDANWAIGENNFGYVALNQALADGKIYVGNGSGIGTAVTPTGDVTISNAGVTAIGALKVTNAMLAGSIAYSKLILTGAILNADLAGSIAASKLVGSDIATVGTLTAGATGAGFTVALSTSTITGTLADARLSANVAMRNAANSFAGHQTPAATDTYDLGSSTLLWRKGWLSELDAVLFAQNTISVIGGWLIVTKDEGTVDEDVDTSETQIDFGTNNIAANDFIVFRSAGAVEYMQATSLVSGTTWNVTRNVDGSGANTWPQGSVWVNFGYNGTGRIELNANSTPRISMLTQGTSYNAQTELLRLGDLNGWGAYVSETYGFATGIYGTASKTWQTIEQTNGIRLGVNTTTLFKVDTSGNVTMGEVATNQGNVFWNTSNKRLEFRGSTAGTVVQAYVDTTGEIVAGVGAVKLSSSGLAITQGAGTSNAVRWVNGSGNEVAKLVSLDASLSLTVLTAQSQSATDISSALVDIQASNSDGGIAEIQIHSQDSAAGNKGYIAMVASSGFDFRGLAIGSTTAPDSGTKLVVHGNAAVFGAFNLTGVLTAGSAPTILTNSAGKILSDALNTVAVAQGGTGDTGTAWTAYTPTITAASGTFTTVSATGRYKTIGKTVFFSVHITITTNGTAAGLVLATLPVTSVNSGARHYAVGQETAVAGFMLFGIVLPNSTTLQLAKYDATYPGASGYVIDASGSYESA